MASRAKVFEHLARSGPAPLPESIIEKKVAEYEKENRRYWAERQRREENVADDFEDLTILRI